MARYLIDGHNLIGQLPDIALSDPDDEVRLLVKLEAYFAGSGDEVVVVFDPGPAPPLDQPPLRPGRITAVFARPPEHADIVVKRLITQDPNCRHLTVVTADREILAFARRNRCRIVRTGEFVARLERPRRPRRRAPAPSQPLPTGELGTAAYLEYWYDYFGVPPEDREA